MGRVEFLKQFAPGTVEEAEVVTDDHIFWTWPKELKQSRSGWAWDKVQYTHRANNNACTTMNVEYWRLRETPSGAALADLVLSERLSKEEQDRLRQAYVDLLKVRYAK